MPKKCYGIRPFLHGFAVIRTDNGKKQLLYLKGVRNGKYTWNRDLTWARVYTETTALKHVKKLENKGEKEMRSENRKKYYQRMKRRARGEAVAFSNHAEELMERSNLSIVEWTNHFWKIGKRYGLLREFKENGVI